eukprot:16449173-Heterocapsa_arctica.AAC.1
MHYHVVAAEARCLLILRRDLHVVLNRELLVEVQMVDANDSVLVTFVVVADLDGRVVRRPCRMVQDVGQRVSVEGHTGGHRPGWRSVGTQYRGRRQEGVNCDVPRSDVPGLVLINSLKEVDEILQVPGEVRLARVLVLGPFPLVGVSHDA